MKDIDEHYEELKEESQAYNGDDSKSMRSYATAYLYSKEDSDNIERINDSLRQITPMLTNDETMSNHQSVMRDNRSVVSMPMSVATKRSHFTLLSYKKK